MTASSVSWRQALFNRRMLICVFTGFSSGLPLYLLINLLPAWLRVEHVDLTAIGLFALVRFPFTWKFLWSPFVDRYALPVFGRRRGWMLLTQLLLLASIPLAHQGHEMMRQVAYRAAEQRLLDHLIQQADDRYGGN